jgi:hypothetical protein
VAVELVAVRFECARVALAGGNLGFEAVKPPAGDGLEAQSWRDRHAPVARRRDQRQPLTPRRGDVEPNRAEAQPARVAPADRVLAVSLAVDAALDPNAAGVVDPIAILLAWDRDPRRERRLRTTKLTES